MNVAAKPLPFLEEEVWRLIEDGPASGVVNMATDEAILRATESLALCGAAPAQAPSPTLRIYSWERPTVSIGYRQDLSAFTGPANIPVVRRITGGRAVLHDSEVTYSIVAPKGSSLYGLGIGGAYLAVSSAIAAALNEVGVEAELTRSKRTGAMGGGAGSGACFQSAARSEVTVGGKKIVGSAQRRFKGAFLQHGSILFDVDRELTEKVFGPGLYESISWVSRFSSVSKMELKEVLTRKIVEILGVSMLGRESLFESESLLRDRLIREKYCDLSLPAL